tara:strand:- start:12325 stop:13137 length:813 start_codon:yes stop_codon:yes gene_type:complete
MDIIAEIGWNHMGDMNLAEEMISSASQSGATIVKFQYWDPKYLKAGAWDEDGRREIYNKAFLTDSKIKSLMTLSAEYDCKFLISVFGTLGAEHMTKFNLDSIKIPSHETANLKLIEFCSNNFKKIYFSAGAATPDEIVRAVELLKKGSAEYFLMHCVSSYPCNDDRANLKRINWLKEFTENVGLSDHTTSSVIPAASVAFGTKVIEKHFTTDHDLPGRDNKFALEPAEFKQMVANISAVKDSMIDHGIDHQDIEYDTMKNYRGRWEPHDY